MVIAVLQVSEIMEHVEERRTTTLHRRKAMNTAFSTSNSLMRETSTKYTTLTLNGTLKKTSPKDDEKSEEEKLKEHGITIEESNIRNFSNISPMEVTNYYKGLGDWQNVLPKTDYAYSPVSIFNKKKINGIYPVIPNMSRRTLWSNRYESTEIADNRKNSFYDKQYSDLSSKRWYLQKNSELSEKEYHYTRSLSSNSTNLRQWISNKCSSISQSSTELYWRWHSYLQSIKIRSTTSLASSYSSTSLRPKNLVQYVFPFLLLFLAIYFFLWSPFPTPSSSAEGYVYKYSGILYTSVSRLIESLFSLVFSVYDFTLSSGTFIFSCISWPHKFSLEAIPDFVFTPFNQEVWSFMTSEHASEDADSRKENIHFDDARIEEIVRRVFDTSSSEFTRKVTNSREFSDIIDEKLKNFKEKHHDKLFRDNINFQERLKVLELLVDESNTSEQIRELQAEILVLREEIRSKETKINNDFIILLSTVFEMKPSEEINFDNLKAKFVSIFRSIEEAHYKINKLNREFSNYVNNASDRIDIVVGRSNERIKLDLKSFIEDLLTKKLEEWKKTSRPTSANLKQDLDGGIEMLENYVKKIVQKALDVYDADKTGMVDYALESSGGIVLSTRCTETRKSHAQFSILGIPFWQTSTSPRTVIQPETHPGECWAFPGSTGYLVIQLSMSIYITGVSLEHIPKAIALNGTIDSAPKDFSVWALRSEMDQEAKLLGKFRYNDDGPSVQYYETVPLDQPYQIVELKILSNHGKIDYTCLYRFRVHGIPA